MLTEEHTPDPVDAARKENLEYLRNTLAEIDRYIAKMIDKRLAYAEAIGQIKSQEGHALRRPDLETDALRRAKAAVAPQNEELVEEVFEELIAASIDLQETKFSYDDA